MNMVVSKTPEIFELTYGEKSHPIWQKIYKHFVEELEHERVELEKSHDEKATAEIRGKIRAIRTMLRLNDEPLIVEDNPLPD